MRLVATERADSPGVAVRIPPARHALHSFAPRILDFDVEARALGYGDPDWVPQEITAIAWSWLDEDRVACQLRVYGVRRMFERFLKAYEQADIITGHNLRRFDLPLLNAELIRNGFQPLSPKLCQDTLRQVVRTKGIKRDQDNLCKLFRLPEEKVSLSWQDWQDAYGEAGWPTIKERVVTDVRQHKLMREEMLRRGWLKPPRPWRP